MATDEIRRVKKAGDDYYRILGVDKDAGDDVIKKAYRKLALRLHPDKCSEDGAEEAFKRVGEAFGTLSDGQKRSVYDQYGAAGLQQRGGGGGGGPDLSPEDIFAAFFGGGGVPGGMGGGNVFMRGSGMGPGVQTFSFSSGGGGGGVFQFSGGGFGGGGDPFGGGGFNRAQRRRQPEPAQDEAPEPGPASPEWLKQLQPVLAALGPVMPIVVLLMMFLGMMLMSTIISFVISRAIFIFPILYLAPGQTKLYLLMGVVGLACLGVL